MSPLYLASNCFSSLVPASTFCLGSKGSLTPNWSAVAGISCIRPCAPFDDTAQGRPPDSSWITARTSSGLTPSCFELVSISSSSRALDRGSQGGRLKETGDSTHGAVKKEAAGTGAL